jgi:hypothetical protein
MKDRVAEVAPNSAEGCTSFPLYESLSNLKAGNALFFTDDIAPSWTLGQDILTAVAAGLPALSSSSRLKTRVDRR